MSSNGPKKPRYHVLDNGYIIPEAFLKEFERSLTYIPEPGDVFICTYPKCGSTWTQYILHLLRNNGEPLKPGENINTFVPHLEDDGKDAVLALPRPRLTKTHLSYDMLPKSDEAKYIFIARNPKDCCVSSYYHMKGFARCEFEDGKFDDFFNLFINGEVMYGDYFDHLLSYLPHKNDPNMLFLLYEEMKMDVKGCITKIGDFLGEPFSLSCEDPEILEKVVHNCSFKAMKAAPPSLWSSERAKGSPGFIRKGEVGDWRKHLTEEQSKLVDEKFRAKLGGTEAEHFWDQFDC